MDKPRLSEQEKEFSLWLKKQAMLTDQIARLQSQVEGFGVRLDGVIEKFGEMSEVIKASPASQ
jgi:hypothetical protein